MAGDEASGSVQDLQWQVELLPSGGGGAPSPSAVVHVVASAEPSAHVRIDVLLAPDGARDLGQRLLAAYHDFRQGHLGSGTPGGARRDAP